MAARGPSRRSFSKLGVDAAVLQKPRAHRAHRALVRGGELLQCASRIERGEQLAVFILRPRLAGLRRHLRLAALEALDALQRARSFIERAHHLRPLVDALGRKYFSRLRIDAVRQRSHYCQCLCLVHSYHPLSAPKAIAKAHWYQRIAIGSADARRELILKDKKLLGFGGRNRAADDFVGKAASLQKARSLGTLFTCRRRLAVFALQDSSCPLELAFSRNAVDDFRGDALALQVLADLCRAVLARKRTSALFCEALIRLLFFG